MHPKILGYTWNNSVLGHKISIGLFPPNVFEGILFIKYVVKTLSNQKDLGTFISKRIALMISNECLLLCSTTLFCYGVYAQEVCDSIPFLVR